MINDNLLLPVIADIENEPVPISIEINVTLKVAENMPYIPSSMLIIKLGIYILKQIIDAIINKSIKHIVSKQKKPFILMNKGLKRGDDILSRV